MKRSDKQSGFSLIEMLVVVVIVGIMAAMAMQSLSTAVEDARRIQTERKMDKLAKAIVGDPGIMQDGTRSNFGYVGDVGAFPSDLNALYTNPGYAVWNGPYVQIDHTEDTTSYRYDAWGQAFSYAGDLTITSTGHGTTMTKKLTDSLSSYLLNSVEGMVRDKNDSMPGVIYRDSVRILVDVPDGSGITTKSYLPQSSGEFFADSIPAGKRYFRFVYLPNNDTVRRYITVLPHNQSDPAPVVKFAGAYFTSGGGGGTCTGTDSMTLRPNAAGALTNIPNLVGCAANWQCVDEAVSDDGTTELTRSNNSFVTDVYNYTDPAATSCPVISVTVWCRCYRDQTQGQIQPAVYVSGTEYRGTALDLTNSWANYSYTWTTNPYTGIGWTWNDIINLQAGPRIKGQSSTKIGHVTQVWVVVKY